MKVMNKFVLAAMLTVAAGVAGLTSANAATYDWNFTPGADGVLANSVIYTNGAPPLSAIATGYTNNGFGTTTALYGKVDGGDENGIGINSDPTADHEIWGSTIIQITLPTGLSNIQAKMGSTTSGETYTIWGSSTSATSGFSQLIANGTSDNSLFSLSALCPTCQYFYFGVGSTAVAQSNVLLEEITAVSAVPLPAALPLFATGLGALGLLGWRRKRKAQAAA
jgi:hypothetical protein